MIEEFVSIHLRAVFFASIGLRVNFVTSFDFDAGRRWCWRLACAGKLLAPVSAARWGGMSTRDRWAVAFAMNSRGAMEIILGLLALEAGVIAQELFVALVVMAIRHVRGQRAADRWSMRRRQRPRLMSVMSPKHFRRNLAATTRRRRHSRADGAAPPALRPQRRAIEALAWEREQVAATGIGNGVALPHARVAGLTQPLVVVGMSDAGLDFDAPDGQLAHIVLLLLTPAESPTAQLDLSANIAELFREPGVLEHVMRARTYTEFLAALKRWPRRADIGSAIAELLWLDRSHSEVLRRVWLAASQRSAILRQDGRAIISPPRNLGGRGVKCFRRPSNRRASEEHRRSPFFSRRGVSMRCFVAINAMLLSAMLAGARRGTGRRRAGPAAARRPPRAG